MTSVMARRLMTSSLRGASALERFVVCEVLADEVDPLSTTPWLHHVRGLLRHVKITRRSELRGRSDFVLHVQLQEACRVLWRTSGYCAGVLRTVANAILQHVGSGYAVVASADEFEDMHPVVEEVVCELGLPDNPDDIEFCLRELSEFCRWYAIHDVQRLLSEEGHARKCLVQMLGNFARVQRWDPTDARALEEWICRRPDAIRWP